MSDINLWCEKFVVFLRELKPKAVVIMLFKAASRLQDSKHWSGAV